jgi:predicted alpha/beta-fold hydrolase
MFVPARGLEGPHAQTVFATLFRTPPHVELRRERWELPDGDFVDVDRMDGPRDAPLLVVLHGLEGSSSAHYVRGLLRRAHERGFRGLALNFRSCSGEPNRMVRSYHSGETGDFGELVRRVREEASRIVVAGCSLGGNVLVKWLGEQGDAVPRELRAAAAISVPFDLDLCASALDGPGFMQWVYRARFLRTLKRKALEKLRAFPGAYAGERVRAARTIRDFDTAVVAAVFGFGTAERYYAESSSGPFVPRVRLPLYLLSARDDPFIPAAAIPQVDNPRVTLEVTERGGHLGFVAGSIARPRFHAEERALEFLAAHV